jgi:hypothetical protein
MKVADALDYGQAESETVTMGAAPVESSEDVG